MANLATVTSADRQKVATLTKAIASLTDQLAEKDMWAKSKESEIKCLLGGRAPNAPIVTAAPAGAYVRNSTRPRMTVTVGHMDTRLDLPTQVPTSPRNILDTRMKPRRTTSWELTIGGFL
jgi:hypothetical protein